MNLADIKSVLSLGAFRPDPDDWHSPVPLRMKGKRYLCVSVNRGGVAWRSVGRRGEFLQAGAAEGDFAEVIPGLAEEWRSMTDGGWAVLSLNNRFVVTLESNLSRKPGAEEAIRTNARSVIGAKYDRGKRYAMYHHPETNASILLASEDSNINAIEQKFAEHGFKIARLSCGIFAMAEDFLRRQHANPEMKGRDFLLVACCMGSVFLMAQKKGQWSDLRCRSGLYTEQDFQPVMNLAAPVVNGLEKGAQMFLLHEQPNTPLAQALNQALQPFGALDVTPPDHLWSTLCTQ